jgi:hypothetical protein
MPLAGRLIKSDSSLPPYLCSSSWRPYRTSGVRYASASVKRLRFMPPTPFNYARQSVANQSGAHDMRQFGPICMQRLPMEPPPPEQMESGDEGGGDARARRLQLQLGLMERLLAPGLFRSWRPLVRRLTSRRFVQSEDCLNLNIYTPIEGE